MKMLHEVINRIQSLMNINESELNEVGDSLENIYPWKLKKGSDNIYIFNSGNVKYAVQFMDNGGGTYERIYHTVKEGDVDNNVMTNKGNALRVNATVMSITLDFLKNNSKWYELIIHPLDERRLHLVLNFLNKHLPQNIRYEVDNGVILIYRKY